MSPSRTVLAAAVLSLVPSAAFAVQVWVAGSSEKIRPDAAPRALAQASLAAARNEFEAFQIVVTGPATQVSARASPLVSRTRSAVDDVKLYRVDLIDARNASAADGGTGRWPDALVPDVDDVVGEQRNAFPFDVPAGESHAIWVEVHVPPDATRGTHVGEVRVHTGEGDATIPVTLDVWGFVLPSTSSLRTHFGLSYGVLGAGHGLWGDDGASLRARYAQLALDHRVSLGGVADDGSRVQFDHFDRFYGALVAGTAPTRLQGARLTSVKYVGGAGSVDEHRRWAQHAREQGWMDRLFDYTCDEPPLTCRWGDIPGRARAAHDADPEFRTLVTTQIRDAQDHGVAGDIDVMVPVVNWIDDKPGSSMAGDQRSRYDAFLASGPAKELWLYQSCMSHGCGGTVNMGSPSEQDRYFTGWPSYAIDASAVRNRAMEWISFVERASGELYWETAFAFSHDAWSSQWDFSGNGDGTLFYPGTPSRIGGHTDIPVASIRLKMIREGMEDYEYLKLLSDLGGADEAREMARSLFPDAHSTDASPERLMAVREAIAHRIMERTGESLGAGGCGSAGGPGGGALIALPALAAMALGRAARRRRVA